MALTQMLLTSPEGEEEKERVASVLGKREKCRVPCSKTQLETKETYTGSFIPINPINYDDSSVYTD